MSFLRRSHRQSHQSLIDTGAVIERLIQRTRQDELTWTQTYRHNWACDADGGTVNIDACSFAQVRVVDEYGVHVPVSFPILKCEKLLRTVHRQERKRKRESEATHKEQLRRQRDGVIDTQTSQGTRHVQFLQDLAGRTPKP